MNRFHLSGRELCELKVQEFCQRSQEYVGDIVHAYLGRFKEGECVVGGRGRGEGTWGGRGEGESIDEYITGR